MKRYLNIVLITLLLFGCGQKGPLFLPDEPEHHGPEELTE